MKTYEGKKQEQMELLESGIEMKKIERRKRVNIVSVKLVREASFLYKNRRIASPSDAWELFKEYLDGVDREHFVVMALDTKNQPTAIHTCHIGSLNASIVHPREVMKVGILSNAASLILVTTIRQIIQNQVKKTSM